MKGIKPFTPIRATRNVVVAAAEAEAEAVEVEDPEFTSLRVEDPEFTAFREDPEIKAFRDASEAEAEIELEEMDFQEWANKFLDGNDLLVDKEGVKEFEAIDQMAEDPDYNPDDYVFDPEDFADVIELMKQQDYIELSAGTANPLVGPLRDKVNRAKTVALAYAKTERDIPLDIGEHMLMGQLALEISKQEDLFISEVDDVRPIKSFSAIDPEEELELTPRQRKAIDAVKLPKNELAALLPNDWDTITVDWLANTREAPVDLPKYRLNFMWLEKNIAFGVDYVYSRGNTSPMTDFFFWPRKDAWEDLKTELESKPFISERDKITMLNRLTEVINYWQEPVGTDVGAVAPSFEGARTLFPDCSFRGQN